MSTWYLIRDHYSGSKVKVEAVKSLVGLALMQEVPKEHILLESIILWKNIALSLAEWQWVQLPNLWLEACIKC